VCACVRVFVPVCDCHA